MRTLNENSRIVWGLVTAGALTNVFGSVFNHRANSVASVGRVRRDCR